MWCNCYMYIHVVVLVIIIIVKYYFGFTTCTCITLLHVLLLLFFYLKIFLLHVTCTCMFIFIFFQIINSGYWSLFLVQMLYLLLSFFSSFWLSYHLEVLFHYCRPFDHASMFYFDLPVLESLLSALLSDFA